MSRRRSAGRIARAFLSFLALDAAVATNSACAPEGPKVVVSLGLSRVDAVSLSRIRLIVRECDAPLLALGTDVPLGDALPDRLEYDAAVEPGRTFYVWAQGWEACVPATTPCVQPDAAAAMPGACTCFDALSPPRQRLTREACSPWLRSPDDGAEVALRLERSMGACPPTPLDRCDEPLP